MPDVVIHHVERNWLALVEAVTSHGPVNVLRHNQVKDLFAGAARMHPGKMSMRSKFLHASWSYDFLLDMIRATRRQM